MKDNIQGTNIDGKKVFIILTNEYKGNPTIVEGAADSVFVYDSKPQTNIIDIKGGSIEVPNPNMKINNPLNGNIPDYGSISIISPSDATLIFKDGTQSDIIGDNTDISKEEI